MVEVINPSLMKTLHKGADGEKTAPIDGLDDKPLDSDPYYFNSYCRNNLTKPKVCQKQRQP